MFRIFGKKKETAPAPTLDDASKNLSTRMADVDAKIKGYDDELLKLKKQMATMRPGPAKENVKRKALQILKQKQMYDKHRSTMMTQQFNIDQTKFTQENLKDTVTHVAAMKAASTELKQQFKDINIDEIEDIHDDMADMMFDHEEINEIMGRAYGVPEELDEADLMNELEGLEEEAEVDMDSETIPNYLVNANTATTTTTTNTTPTANKNRQTETVDELGFAPVPANKIQI